MRGLRGLFNGLAYMIGGTAVSFPIGTGDVGGLISRDLRVGDDEKKFGGLEPGTGEDGRKDRGIGTSYEDSIEQLSVNPGELGGRGDIEPGEVADTGSAETDEFG